MNHALKGGTRHQQGDTTGCLPVRWLPCRPSSVCPHACCLLASAHLPLPGIGVEGDHAGVALGRLLPGQQGPAVPQLEAGVAQPNTLPAGACAAAASVPQRSAHFDAPAAAKRSWMGNGSPRQ